MSRFSFLVLNTECSNVEKRFTRNVTFLATLKFQSIEFDVNLQYTKRKREESNTPIKYTDWDGCMWEHLNFSKKDVNEFLTFREGISFDEKLWVTNNEIRQNSRTLRSQSGFSHFWLWCLVDSVKRNALHAIQFSKFSFHSNFTSRDVSGKIYFK